MVIAARFDQSVDEHACDDVRLYAYRPAGDALALYVEPVEYPADVFRLFLTPREMLRLAVVLVVGAVRWRKPRPWDADMTSEERAEMTALPFR